MSKDSKAKKTKKHYKSLEKKTALWGLIFLLPWLIGLIFFFLRPLFLTFYYVWIKALKYLYKWYLKMT